MIDINDDEFVEKFIIDNIRLIKKNSAAFTKSEAAKSGLTTPQLNVMMELVTEDGLSVKELSKRLSLSHSTVSGIVDRLEARKAVIRKQDISDGRFTQIFISVSLNEYIKNVHHEMCIPVIKAMGKANPDEKLKICEGFTILARLLNESE